VAGKVLRSVARKIRTYGHVQAFLIVMVPPLLKYQLGRYSRGINELG
jgi:hypothetical protein